MKKVIVFYLAFLASYLVQAQVAYYDAIFLSSQKNVHTGKIVLNKTVKELFLQYYPGKIEDDITMDLLDKNPYLQNNFLDQAIHSTGPSFNPINISSLGGLDVTTFADGLAQFMIERAKGEISVAFIQRFKNELEKHPELQVLFPKTSDFIENMLAYEYTIMLPALQKAFDDDLSNMFFNVRSIFELPDYKKVLDDNPEVGILLNSMYIISKLEYGVHPADIIKELNDLPDWENPDLKGTELINLKAVINIGDLISQSLRFNDTVMLLAKNEYEYIQTPDSLYKRKLGIDSITLVKYNKPAWVSDHHLDILLNDETCFKIFLGLLYQQSLNDSIHFVIHMSDKEKDTIIFFHEFLKKNKENIYFLKSQFLKFQRLAVDVDYQLARINKLKSNGVKPTKADYYNFVDVSLDVTEYGSNLVSYFALDNNQFSVVKSNRYLAILRDINEFYKASYGQDYSTMVVYGVNVIEAIYELYTYTKAKDDLDIKVGIFEDKANKYLQKELSNVDWNNINKDIKKTCSLIVDRSIDSLSWDTINNVNEVLGCLVENKNDINTDQNKKVQKIKKKYNNKLEKKYPYESPYYKEHKKIVNDHKGDFPKSLSSILRYGTFMAQIVKADSGAQVKEIIETFALPIGSSSLKKYQVHNVAVNSYLGMSYKNLDPLRSDDEGIFRFYAPVGVSWTPFSFGKGGSVSLFASLLDIGAIVDYRLKYTNDTTISISGGNADTTITKNVEYSNKIQLGNILSPGGYIVYGFGGNLPLALGIGVQYGPGLSRITNEGNVLNNPKWMFNVSLTVDIPIINLHPGRRRSF